MKKSSYQQLTSKIVSMETAVKKVQEWQLRQESVVFTNGCFDILHRGHVVYLAKSSDLGEHLIIGLNTDASVKRQGKGKERPINDEQSRAILLASLAFVDLVILYDEDTPIRVIHELCPNVLVKGADYDAKETDPNKKTYIVGSDFIRENGGEVTTISLEEGFSTTNIIRKIKN